MSNIIYKWSFIDKKDRSSLWYTISVSIVIGLIIWGFITGQYGMSFVILIVSGLMFYIENNSDDEIFIEINELGIKVSESFYDFGQIESYTFIYTGEYAILARFSMNRRGIRNIDLKINNEIALELKSILPTFIQENPNEELGFIDKIVNLLKL